MPQNKSTSRIAAITGKLAVALAALLAPAMLFAKSINVKFDAALTNETGWVYDTGFEYVSTQKKYGFKSGNKNLDQIISPAFDFAITSVVINAEKASNKTTRNMSIRATSGNAAHNAVELVDGIIPPDQVSFTITNIWDKSDAVHSFSLLTTGGNGNLYLTGAIISGVPIIDAPTNLQADDITGTRFRLSWTNPENAVSNRITVSRIIQHEAEGTTLAEYDFNEFSNGGRNPVDITSDFTNTIPAFAGSSLIYLPTNSEDIIQISSGKQQGSLIFDFASFRDVLDEVTNVSMLVSAKKHSSDVTGVWNLEAAQFDDDDNASQTTNVVLGFEFPQSPCAIQIKDPAACKSVTLRPSGTTAGNRRILIDYLAFIRDYSPAITSTNLVKTAFVTDSTTYSVRGLCPRNEYVARITAFDAEGNKSSPSEPLAFTTNGDAIPFSIRIQ